MQNVWPVLQVELLIFKKALFVALLTRILNPRHRAARNTCNGWVCFVKDIWTQALIQNFGGSRIVSCAVFWSVCGFKILVNALIQDFDHSVDLDPGYFPGDGSLILAGKPWPEQLQVCSHSWEEKMNELKDRPGQQRQTFLWLVHSGLVRFVNVLTQESLARSCKQTQHLVTSTLKRTRALQEFGPPSKNCFHYMYPVHLNFGKSTQKHSSVSDCKPLPVDVKDLWRWETASPRPNYNGRTQLKDSLLVPGVLGIILHLAWRERIHQFPEHRSSEKEVYRQKKLRTKHTRRVTSWWKSQTAHAMALCQETVVPAQFECCKSFCNVKKKKQRFVRIVRSFKRIRHELHGGHCKKNMLWLSVGGKRPHQPRIMHLEKGSGLPRRQNRRSN